MHHSSAFSLLELLVALSIFGILVTLSYPRYSHYLLDAHRKSVIGTLLQVANRLEEYHAVEGSYVGANLSTLGIASRVESKDYTVSISHLSDDDYLASATPQGGQKADGCGILTLNASGERTAENQSAEACWK
jgi:type IV pilus assembly protein PilE